MNSVSLQRRLGRALGLMLPAACAATLALGAWTPNAYAATTITVSTTTDELNNNGKCSLREAIQAANTDKKVDSCPAGSGTDTIKLPSGTFKLTLPPPQDDSGVGLKINANVTISGTGASTTIIDANANASAGQGSRAFDIVNNASVTVDRITARNGYDGGGDNGGLVRVTYGGKLNLTNSVIDHGLSGYGGAVYVEENASFTATNSTIRNGSAQYGGGIYNLGTTTLTRVTVSDNSGEVGGGIRNAGTMTIKGGTIANNYADAVGGGILNSGTLTIKDFAKLSGNQANGESDGSGGAIYNWGKLLSENTTFEKNEADFGGAIYNEGRGNATISKGMIKQNAATSDYASQGGGVANYGTLTVKETTIKENAAKTVGGNGGGLYNAGTATVATSAIYNNSATSSFDEGPEANGGGVANVGSLRIVNTTINGNSARNSGGGVFNGNADGSTKAGVTNLSNVTVANNTADADSDGQGDGGGIYNQNYEGNNRLRFANTIIANNTDKGNQAPDIGGQVSSYNYNLIRSQKGGTIRNTQVGNIYNLDPKLGSLNSNGGATKTQALNDGSPALNAANPAKPASGDFTCEATDQRGTKRPDGTGSGRCDIGAYEKSSSNAKANQEFDQSDAGINQPFLPTSEDANADEQAQGSFAPTVQESRPSQVISATEVISQ